MFPSIWALVTTAFARTAVPSSARVPGVGTVTIFTLASVSPESVSAKPKSSASKVYALSSPVVTVLWSAVGAVLVPAAAVTVPDDGYAALVSVSVLSRLSVKLTLTLIFFPASSSVRV